MTTPPQLHPVAHNDTCRMAHGGTDCNCYVNTDLFNGLTEAVNALASLVYTVKDGLFIHDNAGIERPKDTP